MQLWIQGGVAPTLGDSTLLHKESYFLSNFEGHIIKKGLVSLSIFFITKKMHMFSITLRIKPLKYIYLSYRGKLIICWARQCYMWEEWEERKKQSFNLLSDSLWCITLAISNSSLESKGQVYVHVGYACQLVLTTWITVNMNAL